MITTEPGFATSIPPFSPRLSSPLTPSILRSSLVNKCLLFRLTACLLPLLLHTRPGYSQNPPAGFSNTTIASGWVQPTGVCFASDGRMIVWEKAGKVWMLDKNAAGTYVKPASPLLDLSQEVGIWRDHGLLGLALDPQFTTNGRIYLLYVVDRYYLKYHNANNQVLAGYDPSTTNLDKWGASYQSTFGVPFGGSIGRLTRYSARPSDGFHSIDPTSRKVLLGESLSTGVPVLYETHGIGSLAFGSDGSLLVSTGDGASTSVDTGNYPNSYAVQALQDGVITAKENVGSFRSQLIDTHSGKILRLDPLTGNGLPSNPYFDASQPRAPRSRVFALGFRNPFRFTLKPGTGSSDPSVGDPGVLYVGDVGLNTWEELNVVTGKGQNFGWPIYEGLQWNSAFGSNRKANPDAVNPLYNGGSCNQPRFAFVDLLREDTQNTASFPNPCNGAQQVPKNVPHWVHTRPVMDWKHGEAVVRTAGFDNLGNARADMLGTAASPVTGSSFPGSASLAGVWYTANNFPSQYKNTYFHADYASNWLRNLKFNTSNQPTSIGQFINSGAVAVSMAVNNQPSDGALYYVNYKTQEVRRVAYTGNKPPLAVASANKSYGVSPLAVQFSSSGSLNPEGGSVSYLWNFGDGSTSTLANPSHVFTGSGPKKFTVILTVKDAQGVAGTAQVIISVNNTPPVVNITSPVNNSLYSVTSNTDVTYQLRASVSDAQQSGSGLSYQWQTVLHHNTHVHEEPVDNSVSTSTDISPIGCDGQQYYFSISLTVTDAAGLSSSDVVNLYPDCNPSSSNSVSSFTLVNASTDQDLQTLTSGSSLNLATLPTKNLNIRANTSPAKVGSVVFSLSGQQTRSFTEGGAPYSLFGDANGNYNAWVPAVGSYTLKGTPYSAGGGTGTQGSALTISFTVINQPVTNQQKVVSFTLVNANTDQDLQTLSSGSSLNLATLPTKNLNIRANTSPAKVGSVVFNLSGQQLRTYTEGGAPYSLFGDANGNYNAWVPAVGSYTLKGTPFSAGGGTGTQGTALTINFTVINPGARMSTSESGAEKSGELRLSAQPNPFSQRIALTFSSPVEANSILMLYDMRGSSVRSLFEGELEAGEEKQLEVEAGSLPEGIYLLRLVSGRQATYLKVVLAR